MATPGEGRSALTRTRPWAIAAMLACSLLTAAGQVFFKLGAERLPAAVTNWPLAAGLASYGIALALFMTAMRGGQVSVLYPVLAMSYVWTNALASFALAEPVGPLRWAGTAGIVLGISLIGWGSGREDEG